MEAEMSEIKWDVVGVKQRGENLKKLKLGHPFDQVGSETETMGSVGFDVRRKHEKNINSVNSVSTRSSLLFLKLSERYTLQIVQAYGSTSDHADHKVEEFYGYITLALNDTATHFALI